jgi:hypothetical protein
MMGILNLCMKALPGRNVTNMEALRLAVRLPKNELFSGYLQFNFYSIPWKKF